MTTKPEWPEKVYLQREGGGTISGIWHEYQVNANDAEYVSSDIAAAREQAVKDGAELAAKMLGQYSKERELAIIRATLEEVQQTLDLALYMNRLIIAELLDPTEILETLK